MNSEVVLTLRTPRLEGSALTTLKAELRFLARPGRRVTLDFTAVEGVAAAAAKVIVDANARLLKRGGSLQLIGVRNTVAAYFELLRVHHQLRMNPGGASRLALPVAA